MTDDKIKVLVVDDSAFMRKAIEMMLSDAPDIEVIDTARNGQEGYEKVLKLKPDLVTLDIEMPVMDGLSALKKIMDLAPTPVIMVSSLTTDGAESTMEALDNGAVDFIPKQMSFVSLEIVKIKEDLINKVRYFHKNKQSILRKINLQRKINKLRQSGNEQRSFNKVSGQMESGKTNTIRTSLSKEKSLTDKKPIAINNNTEIIVIGSSTGGPAALQKVIPKLPGNLPVPVLVVQHMPPAFTKSLAERLNSLSSVTVQEANNGQMMKAGNVYIAPGDKHMIVKKKNIISLSDSPQDSLHKPSVDVMMQSVCEVYGKNVLAVIMTGMGQDGTKALYSLWQKGAIILGQNEETCVVYGMPKIPNEKGYSQKVLPVEGISDTLINLL